jgi:outer membrane immunogenic protein
MMKRLILATLATAFFATPGAFCGAQAADIAHKSAPFPAPAPYNWTGFFIGIDLGGAFSAQQLNLNAANTPLATATPAQIAALNSITNPGVLGNGAVGAVGGLHAGFNQQVSSFWVLGAETTFAASSLAANTNNLNLSAAAVATNYSAGIPWFGTTVGKVGMVFEPRLMAYVDGGVAYGEIKQNSSISGVLAAPLTGALDNVHVGWTAGAGIEYAVTDHLSIRGDYKYVNLGNNGLQLAGPIAGVGSVAFNPNTTAAFNVVTLGASIKF